MPAALRNSTSLYSVHPGVLSVQKWVAELKGKTGRSLNEWLKHCKKDGPAVEASCHDWLKKKYGMGTNSAWWIAERSLGKGDEDDDPQKYLQAAVRYVDAMYAAKKVRLRPIHDELIKPARKLGKDMHICPCKTMVPLYRNHVFAEIKPATNPRIDLGLSLGATKAKGRPIDTGGYRRRTGSRIGYRSRRLTKLILKSSVGSRRRMTWRRDKGVN